MILEISKDQQDLRDLEAKLEPNLLVRVEQERHSAGGGGLFVAKAGVLGCHAHRLEPERDRTRACKDHFVAFIAQARDIFEQALKEAEARGEAVGISQQARSDLDDNTFGFGHDTLEDYADSWNICAAQYFEYNRKEIKISKIKKRAICLYFK